MVRRHIALRLRGVALNYQLLYVVLCHDTGGRCVSRGHCRRFRAALQLDFQENEASSRRNCHAGTDAVAVQVLPQQTGREHWECLCQIASCRVHDCDAAGIAALPNPCIHAIDTHTSTHTRTQTGQPSELGSTHHTLSSGQVNVFPYLGRPCKVPPLGDRPGRNTRAKCSILHPLQHFRRSTECTSSGCRRSRR